MYDTESMTLDYCGQMCQGLHETNFMGKEVYNRAYEVSGRDKVTRSLENLKKKNILKLYGLQLEMKPTERLKFCL